jgi:hypothetical protein
MNEPLIKNCYFKDKEEKCRSPEIWRKLPISYHMDVGKVCPFNPETSIFYSQSEYNRNPDMGRCRCPEYIEKIPSPVPNDLAEHGEDRK